MARKFQVGDRVVVKPSKYHDWSNERGMLAAYVAKDAWPCKVTIGNDAIPFDARELDKEEQDGKAE